MRSLTPYFENFISGQHIVNSVESKFFSDFLPTIPSPLHIIYTNAKIQFWPFITSESTSKQSLNMQLENTIGNVFFVKNPHSSGSKQKSK